MIFNDFYIFEGDHIELKIVFENMFGALIVVLKSTLDKEDLKESLFLVFALIICFLTSAFFIVNWVLSKALWRPFYKKSIKK